MTSSRPYSRTTCSYIASTCASSARSACTASRPTECSAWSTPTTTPPSLANRPATARPITLPAPLTTQTLPASRFTDSSRPLESRPDHPAIMGAGLICAELGPELLDAGVPELVEDVQRLLPGIPGLSRVAAGIVGVTEVGEDLSFVGAVGEFAEQAERLPVAGEGFAVLPEVVIGIAEAVQGRGFAAAVGQMAVQDQRPSAVIDGFPVVSEHGMQPADRVERIRLSARVTGPLVQAQGNPVV